MFKRFLCLLLVLSMLLPMVPMGAFAEDTAATEQMLAEVPEESGPPASSPEETAPEAAEFPTPEPGDIPPEEPEEIPEDDGELPDSSEAPEEKPIPVDPEEPEELEEPEPEEITTASSGTCGDNLTWTLSSDGTLTISGTGKMTDYGHNSGPFYNRTDIKEVVINSGVTSIGARAFYNCSSLTSITIPNSVTSIGAYAFSDCNSLTSITIPNCVTSIGYYAFSGCSSLTSITIPNSVTSIGNYMFSNCSSLTSISIPNSVTSIGNYAFYYCSSLTSITIPNSVTSIGGSAFYGCRRLTDVYYSGSQSQWNAISIGSNNQCLTNATIHYNSTGGNETSEKCGDDVTWTLSSDGTLTISGTGKMTDYDTDGSPFYNCSDIKKVVINSGVTSIGDYAFSYCTSLTSITIPNSVTSIGNYAFSDCRSLTSITIPNSVTSIGDYAFSFCTSLTSITIPNGVTSIGTYAFSDCNSLTDVYYSGSQSRWNAISIGSYNGCLTNANIHFDDFSDAPSEPLTAVDYVAFSKLAYEDWEVGETVYSRYRTKWEKLFSNNHAQATNAMLFGNIAGWKVVNTSAAWGKGSTGFYAVTFCGETTEGTCYVVAYRGSKSFELSQLAKDPDMFNDWVTNDIPFQVLHSYTGQLQNALDYYEYTRKNDFAEKKAVVTGHSLGGGLAWAVSMVYGVHAESFNGASSFNALYYNRPEIAGKLFQGMDKWNITAHVIDGDAMVGQWDSDYTYLPHILYSKSPQSLTSGLFGCHGLENFLYVQDGTIQMYAHGGKAQNTGLYYSLTPKLALGYSGADKIIYGFDVVESVVSIGATGAGHPIVGTGMAVHSSMGSTLYGGAGADTITRIGWQNDKLVGGRAVPGQHKEVDGGIGNDTYYYFDGDGQQWICDSAGNDVLRLFGITAGSSIEYKKNYTTVNLFGKYGAVLCDGLPIAFISMNHSGTFDIQVCSDDGSVKQSIRVDGFLWDKIQTSLYVACPTAVEILDADGNVVQRLENGGDEITRTDYGNFYVFTNEDGESVKYFDAIDGYSFRIVGEDDGTMDVAICYDEGEVYALESAPVNAGMTATITEDAKPLLVIDADSDGKTDTVMSMAGELEADSLDISQSNLILQPGQFTALDLQSRYEVLKEIAQWSAENADGTGEPVVSVDGSGHVTALRPGTAYVTVSVTVDGKEYSDRCRIDVVEGEGSHPIAENVAEYGADLRQTSAKVSLFSTDYAKVRILLNLKQNMLTPSQLPNAQASNVVPRDIPGNSGAALQSAVFADSTVAELFGLRVVDDRTLEIVPRDETLLLAQATPAKVKASYKSAIVLTVDTQEITTQAITVSVDKKLPTVKAATLKINSFYDTPAAVVFSGCTVSRMEAVSVPTGFTFDAETGTVSYVGTAAKASGKLNLMVVPEGWAVAVSVPVSVSVTRTEPTVKLSPTSVTLLPGSSDKASVKVTVNQPDAPEPEFTLTTSKGVPCEDVSYSYEDGVITLAPKANTPYGASYKLNVQIPGAAKKTTLTVKTATNKVKPALTLKSAGYIDTAIPNSPITLTASMSNYHIGSGESFALTVTKTGGKPKTTVDVTDRFAVKADGNVFTLTESTPGTLEKGYTYEARVQADVNADGIYDCEKTAKLSVKWSDASRVPVSVTLKAKNSIDVIRPASKITLTPTVKNWFGFTPSEDDLVFYTGTGKAQTELVGEKPFRIAVENGAYVLTSNGADSAVKYSVAFRADVKGDGTIVTTKPISLSVKMGSAQMNLNTKAVTLLKKDRYDSAELIFTMKDSALSGIDMVRQDAKSAALVEVKPLGEGVYILRYRNRAVQDLGRGVSVKLEVFLDGNKTAKPNATFTVNVTQK